MKENYFMRRFIIILFVTFILINGGFLYSIEKFYTYYDKALKYMQKGEWERAIAEFKSAASLEFEDARKKRTYGTRFIKYFPHREMGICYYNLDEFDNAMGELQLSYAYKKSKRSEEYIKKLSFDGRNIDFEKNLAERKKHEREQEELALRQKEMEEQKQKEEELARKQKEIEEENKRLEKERKKKEKTELAALEKEIQKKQRELEKERKKLEEQKKRRSNISKLPLGALTYDPNAVTQVGSRLSVAVLTFASNEKAQNLAESVTEKLVTQLVNLRRFRVIERSALDKIMEEQKLGMTGFVDDETAVKVGKLAGADLIVLGRINIEIGFAKVSARGIDTETSELIVAKEVSSGNTNIETIERLVEQVAIDIYNDLPLVEGIIMEVEDTQIILSIGSEVGVRKGTKCVVYKEGKKYYHPQTGEVLGKNVIPLGELIVIQVQEKMSIAKAIGKIGNIQVEDKVVVK
jgi:TolB-like protein